MSQKINAPVDGGVAGRDIVNTKVVHVQFGANHGGQQLVANEPLHIHLAPAAPKPRVTVVIQPGAECIGEPQKVQLRTLVAEVIRLEGLLRRTPRSYGAVWAAVNAKCRATSYHLITHAAFPTAHKFLREWIGRLSSARSAPRVDPQWRKGRFRYIHAAAREVGRSEHLPGLLADHYAGRSLKELTDEELESVCRRVAEWKKQARRNGV